VNCKCYCFFQEVQADWVIIDERLGRRTAQAMNFPVKGTVGIMLAGCQAGLLSKTVALEAVVKLSQQGIRISSQVVAWFKAELDLLQDRCVIEPSKSLDGGALICAGKNSG